MLCCHAQHLCRAREGRIDARFAVGSQHHAHLLQHVAVVIDASLVYADGNGYLGGEEPVERRNAALEPEIRRAVVTDMSAGFSAQVNVGLAHPDTVADGQARPCKAKPCQMRQGRTAGTALRVDFLVGRFDQVHVHRHGMFFGELACHIECLVGQPVQVGGRDLNLDAVIIAGRCHQCFKDVDLIAERNCEALEIGLHLGPQALRQRGREHSVIFIDQPVLVTQGHRIRGAHASLAIGIHDGPACADNRVG